MRSDTITPRDFRSIGVEPVPMVAVLREGEDWARSEVGPETDPPTFDTNQGARRRSVLSIT
jgi:hypothetical protein